MGKLKNYYFEEICNMENYEYEYDYSYEQQLAEEEAQKQEAEPIATDS